LQWTDISHNWSCWLIESIVTFRYSTIHI
jgi:hypothetical protein